ncbi:MAG: transporter [Deltaproteobacteria bacterium]|nr:transporter [Deltaproteobacteria bacterium]
MNFIPVFAVSRSRHLSGPVAFFGILCCATAAFASHPLITDDAGTMGTGKAQLELNGEYGHNKEDEVTTTTTEGAAALTYGINDSIDFIVGLPYLHFREKDAEAFLSEHGLSDTLVEVKWGFYENNGLNLALKPGLTLPIGDDGKGLGSGKTAYSLFFITSTAIDQWAVHLNLGYIQNDNTIDEKKDLWHASLASTVTLNKQFTAVGDLGVESNPDPLADADADPVFFLAGFIYTLSDGLSLDCGFKYGINNSETDYTVLAGITWKF